MGLIPRSAEIAERRTQVYRIPYILALPRFPWIRALVCESAALSIMFTAVVIFAARGNCSAFLFSRIKMATQFCWTTSLYL
jgi:hypothetical protein